MCNKFLLCAKICYLCYFIESRGNDMKKINVAILRGSKTGYIYLSTPITQYNVQQ